MVVLQEVQKPHDKALHVQSSLDFGWSRTVHISLVAGMRTHGFKPEMCQQQFGRIQTLLIQKSI